MKNKKLLYAILFTAVLFINALPVLIFSESAAITKYSIPSFVFAIVYIAWAIFAISFRQYKSLYFLNLYVFGIFAKKIDESYDTTQNSENEFNISAFIYCAAIPTFISLSFFVDDYFEGILRPLEVCIVRDVLIILLGCIPPLAKNIQARKQQQLKDEMDRKEQERRESMGQWK